ncbi:MAG: hypothetical protein FJ147_26560 [Deltaproteobacteria bacterium]|nr:hypothetical protein [Deltaproteobacteria bacterium]
MVWKASLKNCCRLAFPELSGLIAQPEAGDDCAASLADAKLTALNSLAQKRRLFAVGRDVPPPLGPLGYGQLHALAEALYEGRISELTMSEMSALIDRVELAAGGDPHTLSELLRFLDQNDHRF